MTTGCDDGRGHPHGATRWSWLPTVLAITALAFAGLAIPGLVQQADSDPPLPAPATITVVSGAAVSHPLPRSWLGVSTEYWTLPLFARHQVLLERVLAALRVPGDGPLVIRIGGDSADHAFWHPGPRPLPSWAVALTPRWTALASRLVHRLGVRLILDLNLVTGSPSAAARWARAALGHLPPHSVTGFEVGNEPDIYSRHFWSALTAGGAVAGRVLPAVLTPADYVADFRADALALHRAAPGVGLLGPALARPQADAAWISALLASHPRGLAAVSVHRYPYTACARRRRSPAFPTVRRLLSPAASTGMAASLAPALRAARGAGLPLVLTELNSVTCGGRPTVSDSFATALWAPAALFALLRAGVSAVDLHIRANTINAPFALGPHGLTARPLLYGLLLFSRALRSGAGLVPTGVHAGAGLGLGAWTVRSGDRVRVVMVNAGPRPIRARIVLPGEGPAAVQRLLAASPRARSGVTLNGQRLDRAGHWSGRPRLLLLAPTRGGYTLLLPRHSAALATIQLAPPTSVGEPPRSAA